MASENVKDWDLPLPTPENGSELTNDDNITAQQTLRDENASTLFYKPARLVRASRYTEYLAKPKKRTLIDNARQFFEVMSPSERGNRLQRLARKHDTYTLEQIEKVIRSAKAKERIKENTLQRKEIIYYELLTKLELQNRTQYLNYVLNKFSHFIAVLATTMAIPSNMLDPYARMQRGLFCNILHSIGVENVHQIATYYNNSDISEYAVCRKLSHAFLSLITKSLDLASAYNPNIVASHVCHEDAMDNLIKNRLMQAAQKKILKSMKLRQISNMSSDKKLEKCVF